MQFVPSCRLAALRMVSPILLGLSLAWGPSACDSGSEAESAPSEPTWEAISSDGHYRVSLQPEEGAPRTGPLHSWVVSVEDADGVAFEPTRITVGGGMPQHGHGFATLPRVTRSLGEGRYRVEGVKFHMPGEWTFQIGIVGPAGGDAATIVVLVEP